MGLAHGEVTGRFDRKSYSTLHLRATRRAGRRLIGAIRRVSLNRPLFRDARRETARERERHAAPYRISGVNVASARNACIAI